MSLQVYFLRAGDFVKIGWARDVEKRIKALQTANPHELELLGVIPGCDDVERVIHQRFNALHVRGEWYRAESSLLEFVARHGVARERPARPRRAARVDVIVEALHVVVNQALGELISADEFESARIRAVLTALHEKIGERLSWPRARAR